jgi:hypothetical protein
MVDMHLDWGASQFLTEQWQVGLVGYVYQELGCDSGSGDHVGCFQWRVVGVGPLFIINRKDARPRNSAKCSRTRRSGAGLISEKSGCLQVAHLYVAARLGEVRTVGYSGLDLLTLSSSHFDPEPTWCCPRSVPYPRSARMGGGNQANPRALQRRQSPKSTA